MRNASSHTSKRQRVQPKRRQSPKSSITDGDGRQMSSTGGGIGPFGCKTSDASTDQFAVVESAFTEKDELLLFFRLTFEPKKPWHRGTPRKKAIR